MGTGEGPGILLRNAAEVDVAMLLSALRFIGSDYDFHL
jgi:hypothetical protein